MSTGVRKCPRFGNQGQIEVSDDKLFTWSVRSTQNASVGSDNSGTACNWVAHHLQHAAGQSAALNSVLLFAKQIHRSSCCA
jgi:hypothetical protein